MPANSTKPEHATPTKIAIIGAGAMGLGLAATLHQAGSAVRLLTRSENPQAHLASLGVRRSGLFGVAEAPPGAISVEASLQSLKDDPADFILVCTKTTAIRQVSEQLGRIWPTLAKAPPAVLCQNGWGSAQIMAERLPEEKIFNARVITGFDQGEPGQIKITAHAQPIRMGSLFGADPSLLEPLCAAIDRGGIPAETSPSIDQDLWAKMLYNCALNPLGALLQVPYGEIASHDHSRELLESVVREIFKVLKATPYETYWDKASDYLEVFYRDLLPPTRRHESSMLQDLRAGRPTEIDSLCGAVAKLGNENGVTTPVNTALADLVRASTATPADQIAPRRS